MPVDITTIRRQNLLAIYREFVRTRLAAGDRAKGLEQDFAAKLQISPARWSQLKSTAFAISDKIARQIERNLDKKAKVGWLDVPPESKLPDPGEERFIEAARAAWRASNAKGKRDLLHVMKQRLPR